MLVPTEVPLLCAVAQGWSQGRPCGAVEALVCSAVIGGNVEPGDGIEIGPTATVAALRRALAMGGSFCHAGLHVAFLWALASDSRRVAACSFVRQ